MQITHDLKKNRQCYILIISEFVQIIFLAIVLPPNGRLIPINSTNCTIHLNDTCVNI